MHLFRRHSVQPQLSPSPSGARILARWMLWAGIAASGTLAAVPQVQAWTARKDPPAKPFKPKARTASPRPEAKAAPLPAASLAERSQQLLAQPQPAAAALLALLRQASQARESALVAKLASRLLAAPKANVLQLAEAAPLAGSAELSRQIWERAWKLAAGKRALALQVAGGYTDALLAAGDVAQARAVIDAILPFAQAGQRREIYDRMAAAARLSGEIVQTAVILAGSRDPDAHVVAAQLFVEEGQEERGLQLLERSWKSFPGHRALQAALTQALLRQGRREQLRQVVDQVVRLAPGDPLPYLAVVDAHIAARDRRSARDLIDELAHRWPRHDLLLESLIDREQRLGDDGERSRKLYAQLLAAAPRDPQYVEAYAEWLLARGEEKAALLVLERLELAPGGPVQALLRQATLLLGHGRLVPLQVVLDELQSQAPADPRVLRLLAQAAQSTGKPDQAEKLWLRLAELPAKPQAQDRLRAADGRQAILALYRRQEWMSARHTGLLGQLRAAPSPLGLTLLWLDLDAQVEPRAALADALWRQEAGRIRQALGPDPELLLAIAQGWLHRAQPAEALAALLELHPLDPEAAEAPLQQMLDSALARADRELARRIEAVLVGANGLAPSSTVLLRLGDLHQRYADPQGAASLFRRAAAANPGDAQPVARLAALFRQVGDHAQEEAALRDIVQRTSDPDELENAGQRLITVALARGRSGDLVRWLDAVMVQHPRRDVLSRFRSSAYDVWLRSYALEQALGSASTPPAAGAVAEALASGDLGLQARALRQLSASGRSLPPTLAAELLVSDNPSLRRDVALVLGATGQAEAAEQLRDAMATGIDRDEDVLLAQLLALGRLPAVAGLDALLLPLTHRAEGPVALLVLGRRGSPDAAHELLRSAASSRRDHALAAIAALGVLAGRFPSDPALAEARRYLLETGGRVSDLPTDVPRAAALLFALRASRLAQAPQLLADTAVLDSRPTLQRMALALLASVHQPDIRLPPVEIGNVEGLRGLRAQALRETLVPWLSQDPEVLRESVAPFAAELESAWSRAPSSADRQAWCQRWQPLHAPLQPAWQRVCHSARP